MKRFLISSAVLSLAVAANADTYSSLSFQQQDGTTLSVGVESLQMTFTDSGSTLVISNGTESHTVSVADLAKMFFSGSTSTGITEATADSNGELQVYTISGTYVGRFDSRDSMESSASPGIYLVKQNGKTHKIAVK